MDSLNEINWSKSIWEDINDAVCKEMANKVRKAQMAIPTMPCEGKPTEIPNDRINFHDFSIHEGLTKNFVEIYQEFSLTSAQIARETGNYGICKTLARMAAKAIAFGEDAYFFFNKSDFNPTIPNLQSMAEGVGAVRSHLETVIAHN